jgi:hypothetical protein
MLYPCPSCGKLALPNRACPHCGYQTVDQGQQIVDWIASLPEEQREATVRAEPEGNWPPTLVRTYPGSTQADAAARFNWEAWMLGLAGYRPVSQTWGSGGANIGDFAVYGAFAALKSNLGFLTVTYSRTAMPAAVVPAATKRCPDCAEEVLADARICRFCRHEFSDLTA